MVQEKTGQLIKDMRVSLGLTQAALAERLGVSDKAVSKWERGQGYPDISLLAGLSEILGVDMESLISGEMNQQEVTGGNMKKVKFYVCSECGNVMTATADASVSCCGKKLMPLEAVKAQATEKLTVELIENDYYVTSDHEMKKEHYINFVALVTGDTLILKRTYPEWDLSVRIPRLAHGMLMWHCNRDGLFWQVV